MASEALSMLLNRHQNNLYYSSFDENNNDDNSFASYYFDKSKSNEPLNYNNDLTENYIEQKKEESFSVRDQVINEHFEKEKKFLGTITSVNYSEHTFSARLKSSDDCITRDVLFSINNLPKELRVHVEVGRRIIYIYGKQYRNGTVTNVSNIYFRKESKWTQREVELREKKAKELYNLLNGGSLK